VEVDIVRHDHAAPGACWIAQVQPGDTVGLLGPAGGSLPDSDALLLVADMAALPAALRIAQAQSLRGGTWQLLALGTHASDCDYVPASAQVHWHIGPVPSQAAAVDAWLRTQCLSMPTPPSLWLAGNHTLVQDLRAALQAAPIDALAQCKLATYWQ
ncbi:MAG: siderophore-interacting protein, partial [Comamonas sp.]